MGRQTTGDPSITPTPDQEDHGHFRT